MLQVDEEYQPVSLRGSYAITTVSFEALLGGYIAESATKEREQLANSAEYTK